MSNIYGISLGSTQACIARLNSSGFVDVIRNQCDASDTLATAVFFESADNVVIGNSAKDMVETDGERVVQFSHRQLGKPSAMRYVFDGKEYGPEDINGLVLLRLKQMAEEQGFDVQSIVLAIPSYFGVEEKAATKRICDLAGLNVLRIIPEPVAAVLPFLGRRVDKDHTILVYDLGGGSLDLTILKVTANKDQLFTEDSIKILATSGNDMLGGKDWDDKLFDFIMQACCDENGLIPDEIDVETRQLIRSRVETTKKKLSNAESAKVKVIVNGAMTSITITRDEFENLTADKVSQTMTYVEDVLQQAGNAEIDTVLLVGGSTFMPMIREAIEARFPGKVQIEDPDRAIAKGAAIYGGMTLGFPLDDLSLSNPKPWPLQNPAPKKSVNLPLAFMASALRMAMQYNLKNFALHLIATIKFQELSAQRKRTVVKTLHLPSNFDLEIKFELNRDTVESVEVIDKAIRSFQYVYKLNKFDKCSCTRKVDYHSCFNEHDILREEAAYSECLKYAKKMVSVAAVSIEQSCDVVTDQLLSEIPWENFSLEDILSILYAVHPCTQETNSINFRISAE